MAVATTLLAARLLGARRSWLATVEAGVLGWLAGNALQVALDNGDWDAAQLSVATVSTSMVFTMLAAVALDFVARPGSLAHGERAGLLVVPRPLRDLRRLLEPYARYREILRIARRNGLVLPVNGSGHRDRRVPRPPLGVALRSTLEESGVVFVKLGQMASTRDDLLPLSLRGELSRLQDSVAPAPRDAMQVQLETELGASVDSVFAEFDWCPIGSASIAHAYAARLASGEAVIVKVQRPDMERMVERDTAALLHLARLIERRTPQGRDLHVAEVAEEFAHGLRNELDFPLEAANAADLAAATDTSSRVRIPRFYGELSTPRVLVQERLTGATVADRGRMLELGVDPVELADRLVHTMFGHMLSHGHFHADPHPGNVFLLDDGSIGLIDFGATGRLDAAQRAALLQMTVAATGGDGASMRDAIEQVATVGADGEGVSLDRALNRFLAENIGPTRSVAAAFNNLMPLLATFDIRFPRELSVFFRALALLDGTARTISPGYSLVDGMNRLFSGGAASTPAGASMEEQVRAELLRELPRLRKLPAHVDRIATLASRGDLRVRVALFSTEADARVVTTLVNRVVLALAGGLVAVGSSILLTTSESGSLTRVFGFIGLGMSAVLLLRVIAAIVREGDN